MNYENRYSVCRTRYGDQLHTVYEYRREGETEFYTRGRTTCGARVARVSTSKQIQDRPGLLCKKCFDGLNREYLTCEII